MEPIIKPSIRLERLVFKNDKIIELGENDKIIVVGPNNSGKSQLLRDIVELTKNSKNNLNIILKDIEIEIKFNKSDIESFLEAHKNPDSSTCNYNLCEIHNTIHSFDTEKTIAYKLSHIFIKNITAKERLEICEEQENVSPDEIKKKPQHILIHNDELMDKVNKLFYKSFGKELMFDFKGAKKIPIHVGVAPKDKELVDRQSNAYRKEVIKNPKLNIQGDGIKSYTGILFEVLTSEHDVILLDEPEAFLHPPQMRKLGETLASEFSGQMIVATHSSDILRGFLEGTKGNIKIIRLQRNDENNLIFEADVDAIKELWKKPNLRFSNALDGIFHEQIIICEDDSDCRLYNYTAEWLKTENNEQWLDTAYVPSGGKSAIHGIASVLRKIGVPTKAVFDIDFLSDKKMIEDTVNSFGGNSNDILKIWSRVDGYVRKGIKPNTNEQIKNKIIEIINESETEELKKSDIQDAMKTGQPWAMLKQTGIVGIPSGDPSIELDKLIDMLEAIGIYIVPVGEIERFNRKISGHGPKFVTKVLTEHSLDEKEFSDLKVFVEKVHKGSHSII